MLKILCVILAAVFGGMSHSAAVLYGEVFDTDITIRSGQDISNGISITDAITINNHGTISGVLDICDGCQVLIRNFGVFSADVHLGTNARLVQVISSNAEITQLDTNGAPYDVWVDGGNDLSLNDILRVGRTAVGITFDNTVLCINGRIDRAIYASEIEFVGNVIIKVKNADDILQSGFLDDVKIDGRLIIVADDTAPLYGLQVSRNGDEIVVTHVRVTDYATLFGNARGDFLNRLRIWNPRDPLLGRLDAAKSLGEIDDIIARSVRLNPINLMRGVRMMNDLELADVFRPIYRTHMFAAPMWIRSGDFDVYGFRAGLDVRASGALAFSITGYAGIMEYADDINEYSADVYGANIMADYDFDIVFVRGAFGATYATFDVGPVLDGDKVKFNPNGMSFYSDMDIGHRFKIANDLSLAPFVGARMDHASVLGQSDTNPNLHIGGDVAMSYTVDGLRYDYAARVAVASDGNVVGSVHIAAWSEMDDAGAEFTISTTRDEFGRAYRVSIGGRYRF